MRTLPDEGDRGVHMGRRLCRTARERGVDPDGVALLERLYAVAMAPRRAALGDPRHPDFLHPGRTALILLMDAAARDVELLAAALLLDTGRPELEPGDEAVRRAVGDPGRVVGEALALRDAVPRPDAPDLTEALVVAPGPVRLLALAERLDHLRHVHLRQDATGSEDLRERVRGVYLPVAERTHAILARRYASWCRTFAPRRG